MKATCQALRPEGADLHHSAARCPSPKQPRKRAGATSAEMPTTSRSSPLAADPGDFYRVLRAADADRPHGDDHRRGAGAGKELNRPRAARLRQPPRRPQFVAINMPGDPGSDLHRIRAVRPREGPSPAPMPAQPARFGGRERHAVPRRDRRHADGGADPPAARAQRASTPPVGGRTAIKTDVRIVAATNKDRASSSSRASSAIGLRPSASTSTRAAALRPLPTREDLRSP